MMEIYYQKQDLWLLIFAVFWILVWIFVRILQLLAILYGKWRLHKQPRISGNILEQSLPGVSILKPLSDSDDCNLFSNLETFFTLDYPGPFEILFCIQDKSDKILQAYIERLSIVYPDVETQVFHGGKDVGINPKINNMYPGYASSKYELILISDSRIRMKKDTLTDMVSCMAENTGLVHQMPFTYNETGIFSATLERIHFGTSFARMYLVANFVGLNCAVGMSSMVRKCILEKSGGLESFGKYLAEDFFIAQAVLDSGRKICISSQPALQNSKQGDISSFHSRITRWTKLRIAMTPIAIFCEPFSECMLLGSLTTWSVMTVFGWDPLSFFFIHLLIWFLMDWILLLVIQNGEWPFNKFDFLVIWVYRELTVPYLYITSFLSPDIKWGSKRFRLKFGGVAEVLKEGPAEYSQLKMLPNAVTNSICNDNSNPANFLLASG